MFEFRHLAVFVSDLRRAEQYYQDLFRMELIGREAEGEDGETYALPPNRGWEEAEEAGIQLSLVALRRDEVILALFRGQAGHDCHGTRLAARSSEVLAANRSRPRRIARIGTRRPTSH